MISTVIASFVEKEINPRKHMRIHTPTVVKGGGVGGSWMEPLPRVFYMLQYFETILPSWKAFHLLDKMRHILWVVALLEVCDVTKNGRHLGFYKELQIRLKAR